MFALQLRCRYWEMVPETAVAVNYSSSAYQLTFETFSKFLSFDINT